MKQLIIHNKIDGEVINSMSWEIHHKYFFYELMNK